MQFNANSYSEPPWVVGKQVSIKSDHVRNILYQEMAPVTTHLPVRFKTKKFNDITLTTPALAEYEADCHQEEKTQSTHVIEEMLTILPRREDTLC